MHVVITGASSGIGEAIAREYFSRNARLTRVLLDAFTPKIRSVA